MVGAVRPIALACGRPTVLIRAKLFGFAGAVDRPPEMRELELPDGSSVQDLLSYLRISGSDVLAVTVNGDLVTLKATLRHGDVVALSGPDDVSSVGG